MGLFGESEEKREQMIQSMMAQYGLEDLTDPKDIQCVQDIAYDLYEHGMIDFASRFHGKGTDAAQLAYLNAIMQQNFIIIRLLDKIANK